KSGDRPRPGERQDRGDIARHRTELHAVGASVLAGREKAFALWHTGNAGGFGPHRMSLAGHLGFCGRRHGDRACVSQAWFVAGAAGEKTQGLTAGGWSRGGPRDPSFFDLLTPGDVPAMILRHGKTT